MNREQGEKCQIAKVNRVVYGVNSQKEYKVEWCHSWNF